MPIPNQTPQEITINTMLSWPQGTPAANAPRTGRELQVFHLTGFLQSARIVPDDCDLHMEVSQTAERTAPRVIMETPIDGEYCGARQQLQESLAASGFTVSTTSGDLPQPLAVDVTGLAFEDYGHNRGSAQVATVWELHPATVTLRQ